MIHQRLSNSNGRPRGVKGTPLKVLTHFSSFTYEMKKPAPHTNHGANFHVSVMSSKTALIIQAYTEI